MNRQQSDTEDSNGADTEDSNGADTEDSNRADTEDRSGAERNSGVDIEEAPQRTEAG